MNRLAIYSVLIVCSVLVAGAGISVPAASGAVVDVSTVAQLQAAVANLTSGTTIRVAPGRYQLTQELRIRNGVQNVTLAGATGNRQDVVKIGRAHV